MAKTFVPHQAPGRSNTNRDGLTPQQEINHLGAAGIGPAPKAPKPRAPKPRTRPKAPKTTPMVQKVQKFERQTALW